MTITSFLALSRHLRHQTTCSSHPVQKIPHIQIAPVYITLRGPLWRLFEVRTDYKRRTTYGPGHYGLVARRIRYTYLDCRNCTTTNIFWTGMTSCIIITDGLEQLLFSRLRWPSLLPSHRSRPRQDAHPQGEVH